MAELRNVSYRNGIKCRSARNATPPASTKGGPRHYRRLFGLVMPVAFLLAMMTGVYTTSAARAAGPDWLNTTESPTVFAQFPDFNYDPVIEDNSGCDNVPFKLSNGSTTTQCLMQVKSGQIGSGFYLPNNAYIGNTLSNAGFGGIPNTDEGYFTTTDNRLVLYPGISTHVLPNIGTGFQSYTVGSNSNDYIMADASGAQFFVDANTISTTANGAWMVVLDTSAHAFVRINLQTNALIPFAPATGSPSSTSTAISNDGRYAAIHNPSSGSQSLIIYDLSTCGSVPAHITTYVSCNSRDIQSSVSSAVPGYVNFQRIRFSTDYLINIKAYGHSNGSDTIEQYAIEAPGLSSGALQYLGLGDSYSSGEGAAGDPNSPSENTDSGGYVIGTNEPSAPVNMCHSSPESYPDVIAQALGYTSSQFKTVACSGAIYQDALTTAQYPTAPPDSNLGSWLPGLEPQLQHVADELPQVMTMTMGGNDERYSKMVLTGMEV